MSDAAELVLTAMALLLVKHAIADFWLQTTYQYQNKGRYGHPGGLLHSFIHAALTAPVFLLIPLEPIPIAAILLAEFLVHYHVDWLKEKYIAARALTPLKVGFWHALGVDQLIHGLTYVAIIAVALSLR